MIAIKYRKQQSTSSAVVSGKALHVGCQQQYMGHQSGCVSVLVCVLWCMLVATLVVLVSVYVCAFVVFCVTVAPAFVCTRTWFHSRTWLVKMKPGACAYRCRGYSHTQHYKGTHIDGHEHNECGHKHVTKR